MDQYQGIGSRNRLLTQAQIEQVHAYALRLMQETGCRVECQEALDLLGRAGCDVQDPSRVKIPGRLVQEALDAAPEKIEVYDRNGRPAMIFAEDNCYYGTGSDCPTTIDLYSGQRRPSSKMDVGNLACFCDLFQKTFWIPRFFDRSVFEKWQERGGKDMRASLTEKARDIFEGHDPEKLPDDVQVSLQKIVASHCPGHEE